MDHGHRVRNAIVRYDLALFERLNEEYRTTPIVNLDGLNTRRRMLSPIDEDRAAATRSRRVQAAASAQLAPVLGDVDVAGKVVLEVGCGHGYLTAALAEIGRAARVIGVDVERASSWDDHRDSPITLVETDFSVVPIVAPGTVDVVVSHVAFEHMSRPLQMLAAIYEALTAGGTAWLQMNLYRARNASHRYRQVYFPWPHLLFDDAVCAAYFRKWHGEATSFEWVNKLTVAEYLLAAHELGFEVVRVQRRVAPIDVPFYVRFADRLGRYPALDLETDFMILVLRKPARPPETLDLRALGIRYLERQHALEDEIVRYVIEQDADADPSIDAARDLA
jgi:SAM-dependent methyltransferase